MFNAKGAARDLLKTFRSWDAMKRQAYFGYTPTDAQMRKAAIYVAHQLRKAAALADRTGMSDKEALDVITNQGLRNDAE